MSVAVAERDLGVGRERERLLRHEVSAATGNTSRTQGVFLYRPWGLDAGSLSPRSVSLVETSYLRVLEGLCVLVWLMSWTLSLTYVVMVGSLGVAMKLALRTFTWQEVVILAAIAYIGVAVILLASGTRVHFLFGLDGTMAALSAVIAPLSLIVLFGALRSGEVSRVVPITASYPLATVILAAMVLKEPISPVVLTGTLLIVAGAILVALGG